MIRLAGRRQRLSAGAVQLQAACRIESDAFDPEPAWGEALPEKRPRVESGISGSDEGAASTDDEDGGPRRGALPQVDGRGGSQPPEQLQQQRRDRADPTANGAQDEQRGGNIVNSYAGRLRSGFKGSSVPNALPPQPASTSGREDVQRPGFRRSRAPRPSQGSGKKHCGEPPAASKPPPTTTDAQIEAFVAAGAAVLARMLPADRAAHDEERTAFRSACANAGEFYVDDDRRVW